MHPLIEAYEKIIKKEKPDVVLVNGTYYLPWCLYQAAKRQKIRTVLHYHGSLVKETENWDPKSKEIFRQMESSFDAKGIFYIFPSAFAKQSVEADIFGHTIKNVAVLPNPIPLHFFDAPQRKSKKRGKVGIVGRWARVKNPQFVERFAKYNARNGSSFSIESVSDIRKNSAHYKKMKDIVKFRHPIENEKLPSFYNKMDVILSPSHFETYGNVAQEAIASGTPALVSANMGVVETFKKFGLENWIVEFNSAAKVYKKISEVAGQTVSSETREEMRASLNPEIIHKQLLDTLRA